MKKKWQAKNWQKLFFILVLLIFIFIILFRFAELKEITNLLKRAKPIWIAAAVCFQFAVFAFLACLYRCILKSGKRKGKRKAVSFFYLLKTVIAMYFIDHILPSFSASGNVLLYYSARKKKIKKDKASLLIGLNIFMNFLIYVILFIISLILLYSKIIQKIWILGFLIIIAFTMLYRIIWTASGQKHFKNFLSWLLHYWPKAKKNALKTISNFYKAKKSIKKQKFMLFLFYTILVYIFKIATIAAVFLSLNYIINPAVLITGYIITSAVALLSYVRIGVYEASMTLAYSMLGISYNLALTATLLYRGISFWLPMLLGFIFFRKLIQKNKATDKNIIKTAKY